MSKQLDLIGEKYGRLTVIGIGEVKNRNRCWICKCDCGNTVTVPGRALRSGHTRSCGCLLHESRVKNGKKKATHGMTETRLYQVWRGMLARCNRKTHRFYPLYGGRGISVCDEWSNDFSAFAKWAIDHGYDENAPKGACTLDRIDSDGNYEPSNCRFADSKVQQNNRRDRHKNVKLICDERGVFHVAEPSIASA